MAALFAAACTDEKTESDAAVQMDSVQTASDSLCEPVSQAVIDSIKQVAQETKVEQVAQDEYAVLETSMGDIVVEFFPDVAPQHSRSFKRLATIGFFDCTYFHRVIEDFVIQGGDILTRDDSPLNDGTGGPGYNIPAEFNDIPHDLGVLSMARSSDPNSAGSQFFICLSRERTKPLDGQYTVFGKVVKGMDVVQEIGSTEVKENPATGEPSFPVEPVYLYRVYMINKADL